MTIEHPSITRLKALREGGQVQRAHTVPHHGSYSVAEHSYGVAQLILNFYPNCSLDLIKAALEHDVAERWVGDTPSPAKWMAPQIRQGLDIAEQKVETRFDLMPGLTTDERRILKAADLLEFWLWATEQLMMGNNYLAKTIQNVHDFIDSAPEDFLPTAFRILFENYRWDPLPDRII